MAGGVQPRDWSDGGDSRSRDIMQYPCVVVLGAGGEVVNKWSGSPLPQFDQVSYVLRSV